MKILAISRDDIYGGETASYEWASFLSFSAWVRQKLIAAGFDMTRTICQDEDADGNRVYAQIEQGENGVIRFTMSSS